LRDFSLAEASHADAPWKAGFVAMHDKRLAASKLSGIRVRL
jgi:hypothetical protein